MRKHTPSDTTLKVVFLIAAAVLNAVAGFSTSNFTETGECQGEQMCLYEYVVKQQYFAGEGQQNSSITAEVGIMCDSVGVYNGMESIMYCMTISDIEIQGTMFQDDEDVNTEQAQQYRKEYVLKNLAGHFCFVQTSDGKIPAVYYTAQQSDVTINFKKGIASAFQANFKGTETEEEVDPQSIHMSHYRIIPSEEGTVKMHRSVNGDDVIAYTTGAPKSDLKLTKEEDVEYQSGKLRHSAGNTSVKVSKSDNEEDQGHSFSKLYSASGSYTLDLKQCSPVVKRAYSRHRRSVSDEMEVSRMEESLEAKHNQTNSEMEEMERLREKIPSVIDALFELTENPNNTKIADTIENLLGLENKHGPLPGFSPALSDVLEYFSTIQESTNPDDAHMRAIVYSLLAAEGSFQSQMVLLDALNAFAISNEEKTVLINEIAMVENPRMDFVHSLKDYFDTAAMARDIDIAEPLLLALGALASGAPLEVEEFIVNTLLELESKANVDDEETENLITVPLILAMGNTGSKQVLSSLLSYLDTSDEDIQIITVQALKKFTFNQEVLDKLEQLLVEQNDDDTLAAVIEVLVMGLEYSTNFDPEHFDAHKDFLSRHLILTTLTMATLETNNTKFDSLVVGFLNDVGGEQADSLLNQFHSLAKRGTDWDESSSLYDLVASYSDRRNDVNTHPRHRAYIWGKRFGIDEANLEVAAGAFGGISNDCNYVKAYGKAIARGKLLSRRKTFAEILVNLRKTPTNIDGRIYVSLGGDTLADYSRNYQLSSLQCYNYERQLAERRYQVFRFRYSIFVYVASISLTVEMHATLSIGFDASVCGQTAHSELVTATAGLTPRVGVSVSGGASANLLSLARGGITATATFIYQIEPRADAEACRRDCSFQYQACAGIYDSWPGNTLDIETWYQTRTIRWCGGWIKYPCIKWGRRRRWDAFSWRWSLGSRSRQSLYRSCFGTNNPQCPRYEG